MITDIIEDLDYKNLVTKQISETINLLLDKDEEFSITANIDTATFTPELPEAIQNQLAQFSLFILSNYTYTTVQIDDDFLSFEAGYGSENFGSVAKIPLHSIFQISIDDSILFINSAATVEKFNKKSEINSFNVFKNNPKNKKFNK